MKIITKLSIILLFLFISNFSFAQEEVILQTAKDTVQTNDSGEVFVFLTDGPEFMGGDEARIKYLQQTIHYPKKAMEENMQGTVYITFVVEKDGSISNIKVLQGVCESLDAEAVRVVRGMPNWKPGMQRGKPARVQYNMPIKFVLMGDGPTQLTKAEKKALKKKQKAEAKAKKKAEKMARKK